MKAEQTRWTEAGGWAPALPGKLGDSAQVLFLFGSSRVLQQERELKNLSDAYPRAHMFGCSTAGEICGTEVSDDTLVATAIHFDHTRVEASSLPISRAEDSFEAGRSLTASLSKDDLAHVLV